MNLFKDLSSISNLSSLECFVDEKISAIDEFNNSEFTDIEKDRELIEGFILLKANIIEELDYSRSYNRAFILILLQLCERFSFISAIQIIYRILIENNIRIGDRLQAAMLYLQGVDSNTSLINKFDDICTKIQFAISFEEDNDNLALSTFINYYATILRDTHPHIQFIIEIKQKIENAIKHNSYEFLKNKAIISILSLDINNTELSLEKIQQIVDKLLNKKSAKRTIQAVKDLLIEDSGYYADQLKKINNSFVDIRAISVDHSDGKDLTNRGVKILESEKELFSYMRRFGNMHRAKLEEAYAILPKSFSSKVNIIDWGCGQGIASMIFLEYFSNHIINHIVLIEPSIIALKRAALHVHNYDPTNPSETICLKFDELSKNIFNNIDNEIIINIFSNVLDMADYSQEKLLKLITQTQIGEIYFICVSPHIDDIKTNRVDSFKRFFEKNYTSFTLLGTETNGGMPNDNYWHCNNNFNKNMCFNHPVKGCSNKWTRVIRVFKVII